MRMFRFRDGRFSFWEAVFERHVIVFRVREDRDPRERALEKGYPQDIPIQGASPDHIQAWLNGHPDYPVLEESMEAF